MKIFPIEKNIVDSISPIIRNDNEDIKLDIFFFNYLTDYKDNKGQLIYRIWLEVLFEKIIQDYNNYIKEYNINQDNDILILLKQMNTIIFEDTFIKWKIHNFIEIENIANNIVKGCNILEEKYIKDLQERLIYILLNNNNDKDNLKNIKNNIAAYIEWLLININIGELSNKWIIVLENEENDKVFSIDKDYSINDIISEFNTLIEESIEDWLEENTGQYNNIPLDVYFVLHDVVFNFMLEELWIKWKKINHKIVFSKK